MTASTQSRQLVRPALILALVPVLLASCCLLLSRPGDSAATIQAAYELQSRWEDRLQDLDSEQVEAVAIDVVAGSVELGLVLGPIQTETDTSGRTLFEAKLVNIADFPVARPRAILRLEDEHGQLVETVDLAGELDVLASGETELLRGDFAPSATTPRIVEETIILLSEGFLRFGTYSYEEVREEPGLLSRVAGLLPFVQYEAVWTNPSAPWTSYEIQFRIDGVLRD